MRIRSSALTALSFLVVGCALNPNPEIGPEPYQPLDAHVFADGTGNFVFSTSHRAYVAVFEISPYDGVGLLYPQIGGQEASAVSMGWVLPGFSTYRWAYLSQTGGSLLASMYLGPRYIFMIASDQPLNVSALVARPFALRRAMGYTAFQARRPYETMDQLAAMAIPDPEHTKWATDVYMVWPQVRYPPERYILVNCDGYLVRVPLLYALSLARSCGASPRNVIATAVPRPTHSDTVNAIGKVDRRHRGKEPTPVASDPSTVELQSVDRYLMGRKGLADAIRDPRELRHGVPIEPTTPGRFTGIDGRGTSSFEEHQRLLDGQRGALPAYDGRVGSRRLTHPSNTQRRGYPSASSTRSSQRGRTSTGPSRSSASPTHSAPAPRSSTTTRSAPSHSAPPASSSSGGSHSHGHGHGH